MKTTKVFENQAWCNKFQHPVETVKKQLSWSCCALLIFEGENNRRGLKMNACKVDALDS
jgi:hypothetical protein